MVLSIVGISAPIPCHEIAIVLIDLYYNRIDMIFPPR